MAAPREVEVLARPRHLLLGALELGAGDEALGEERLQVGERRLRLLQLPLGVGHRGGRLLLLHPALALLHVLQLEVALLDAQAGGGQLLLVLDGLELQVLAGLQTSASAWASSAWFCRISSSKGAASKRTRRSPFWTSFPSGARATILAWLLWMVEA